jgi:hypothetical protein
MAKRAGKPQTAKSGTGTVSVLPVQLRRGDTFSDEAGTWDTSPLRKPVGPIHSPAHTRPVIALRESPAGYGIVERPRPAEDASHRGAHGRHRRHRRATARGESASHHAADPSRLPPRLCSDFATLAGTVGRSRAWFRHVRRDGGWHGSRMLTICCRERNAAIEAAKVMVRLAGVEPATLGLEVEGGAPIATHL